MKKFTDMNGAKAYVEIAGKGFPLVLVHAGITDSRMWDEQFEVFAQYYTVIRYDRRGFGKTKMGAGDYSHYQDLHGLLQELEIVSANFVGCSQGARTIIDLALEYPEMVKSMVLVSPAISGFAFNGESPRQMQQLQLADAAADIEQVNELELQIWLDGPHRTPDQVNPLVRERVREMNRIALQTPMDLGIELPLKLAAVDRLGEIHHPTCIIIGALDTPKTLAAADILAQQVPGAVSIRIEGAAHLPNMEKAEAFNRQVLAFLTDQGR